MWYLISGKLMSFITYISFKNLLNSNKTYVTSITKFFGWFLIEHIKEDYDKTSGKFFLINEDFRNLIKNLLIVIRNVLIWSHLLTSFEFILTLSILMLLTPFLFYCLKLNRTKNFFLESVLFFYYLLVIFVLSLKLFFSFNWFDLCFIFNPIITLLIVIFICCKFFFYFYNYILNNRNIILIIKVVYYFLSFFCVFFSFVLSMDVINNNVIQENVLKFLSIYLYLLLKY